jgi:hypothetical protein
MSSHRQGKRLGPRVTGWVFPGGSEIIRLAFDPAFTGGVFVG